jgi:hypothetical protein
MLSRYANSVVDNTLDIRVFLLMRSIEKWYCNLFLVYKKEKIGADLTEAASLSGQELSHKYRRGHQAQ